MPRTKEAKASQDDDAQAQDQASQADPAVNGTAQEPDSQAAGGQSQEPAATNDLDALTERLERTERQLAEVQATKDREVMAANQRYQGLVKKLTRDRSKEEAQRMRTLAREDPETFAEEYLTSFERSQVEDEIREETLAGAGERFLMAAWQNPAYEGLADAEKTQIVERILAGGGGAAEVVAAWAQELYERGSKTVTQEAAELRKRLEALENRSTAESLDNPEIGPDGNPPANAGTGTPDMRTVRGVLQAKREGRITEAEARQKLHEIGG